jgi:hypothetical protein
MNIRIFSAVTLLLGLPISMHAQNAALVKPTPIAATAPTVVPTLVPYSGVALASNGKPLAGQATMTFQLFTTEQGGKPLWTESQTVDIDATRHYQVQLGATLASGLPLTTFASGEGRWLGIQIASQPQQPRVLLMSVPYTMKAADAATLGGLPASSYALSGTTTTAAVPSSATPDTSSTVTTTGGTAVYLPVFSGAATIDDSTLFQPGTYIGVGTVTPRQGSGAAVGFSDGWPLLSGESGTAVGRLRSVTLIVLETRIDDLAHF